MDLLSSIGSEVCFVLDCVATVQEQSGSFASTVYTGMLLMTQSAVLKTLTAEGCYTDMLINRVCLYETSDQGQQKNVTVTPHNHFILYKL